MKKTYEEVELEIVQFAEEDVIVTSTCDLDGTFG